VLSGGAAHPLVCRRRAVGMGRPSLRAAAHLSGSAFDLNTHDGPIVGIVLHRSRQQPNYLDRPTMARPTPASYQRDLVVYGTIFLVVASLYSAQVVILPIVLAILLAFVLAPVVGFLQRHGIHRIISVSLVVGLATVAFIGVILAVGYQARQLMIEI